MHHCPSCGEENPGRARFCLGCGTSLGAASSRDVRKTVTIVFSDVVGSSGLGERLDPEDLRGVMTRYYEWANAVLSRHGGRVQKFIGDAVMAIFGVPVVREDDAMRGVRAAMELHTGLAALNEELQAGFGVRLNLRTGVSTGEIVVGDSYGGQDIALGDVVNTAARLEQNAEPGEVLLGDVTYRLVRDAVTVELLAPLALRGKALPVEAWRLLALKPGAAGHTRSFDTPMVGRERELALLLQAFDRAVAEGTGHLVTLLGNAGVGKSRMLQELLSRTPGKVRVLSGRCLDYGEGMTYLPLAEVVRQAAGAEATDEPAQVRGKLRALLSGAETTNAEALGALLGDTGAGGVEELEGAVHALLRALTAQGPLIVVLDDLQWAEGVLLDLVERLAATLRGAPVLLCCIARPELLEVRPGWGGGRVNATTLLLEPLSQPETRILLDNLLGGLGGADDTRRRLVEAAEGNPLYLEELVSMLIEDGLLARGEEGWVTTADLSSLVTPPSIAALLAARLDALPGGERAVLERASVVGTVFYRGALLALSPPDERPQVTEHLLNLVRKDLIRPDPATQLGENGLRFRHLLLRDAAYHSLSKRERSELHERYADWLGETMTERVNEVEEVVGYHLEQACRYRTGLGPPDPTTVDLASRAAHHLVAAGRRAFGRRDMPGTVNLLSRGAALMPAQSAARLALLPDLAAALVEMGEFRRAHPLLVEALEAADRNGDSHLMTAALRVHDVLRLFMGPQESPPRPEPSVLLSQAPAGSARGSGSSAVAAGWTLLHDVSWLPRSRTGSGPAAAALSTGPDRDAATMDAFAVTAVLGPTPVREGIERYTDYLGRSRTNRTLVVRALAALAGLTAMEGSFDQARAHLAEAWTILDQLGLRVRAVALSYLAGMIDLLADEPAAAEEKLRRGCEDCDRMGEKYVAGNLLALLAHATYAQGRYVEAAQLAEAGEGAGPADEIVGPLTARAARAKALARLGRTAEAEALARSVVAAASQTDLLNVHGDALLDLAEVLEIRGETGQAIDTARRALRLYRRKGNAVAVRRTQNVLGRLHP